MKLFLLLLAFIAAPALASPSFSISDAQCNLGLHCIFTITKTGKAITYSDVAFASSGAAAQSLTSTIRFQRGDTVKTVADQSLAPGQFTATIRAVRYAYIARGTAVGTVIGTAPAPPAPAPAPAPTPAPAPVPPATVAGYVPSPTLEGGPRLNAAFDYNLGLQSSWGTGAIPGIYSPDEGAFRFTCGDERLVNRDDMLMFPGQPGKSHGHKYWGNASVNAYSTPDTLALQRNSSCNRSSYTLNHSAYWMPWVEDDQGNIRNAEWVAVYYKRYRKSSRFCDPANTAVIGKQGCAGLPNGIRFVFGWDPTRPTQPATGMSWYCTAGTGVHYSNLDDLFNLGACPVGALMVADLIAGNCWDAKNLDSPDHRSHVTMADYSSGTGLHCDDAHPVLIPQTEDKVAFTVTADMIGTNPDGSKYSRVRCSSDVMMPGAKACATMHADYVEQWVFPVKQLWTDNCIDKGLNCSGGDLGNGQQMIGADIPVYGWGQPVPKTLISSVPQTMVMP